jgi:hypothetical protein
MKRSVFRLYTQRGVNQLLGNAVIEIGMAGGQVLREHFGFTGDQVSEWLKLTIEQAKANRQGGVSDATDSTQKA